MATGTHTHIRRERVYHISTVRRRYRRKKRARRVALCTVFSTLSPLAADRWVLSVSLFSTADRFELRDDAEASLSNAMGCYLAQRLCAHGRPERAGRRDGYEGVAVRRLECDPVPNLQSVQFAMSKMSRQNNFKSRVDTSSCEVPLGCLF